MCAHARFRTRGCLQTIQGNMLVPPLCRRCEVADNQNTSCIPAVVTTSPCRSLYGEILHLLKCVFLHQEKYRSPQSTVLGACGLVRASSSSHLPRTAFYYRRFCRLRGIVCRQTISVCRLFIFEVDSRLVPYDIHVSSSSYMPYIYPPLHVQRKRMGQYKTPILTN